MLRKAFGAFVVALVALAPSFAKADFHAGAWEFTLGGSGGAITLTTQGTLFYGAGTISANAAGGGAGAFSGGTIQITSGTAAVLSGGVGPLALGSGVPCYQGFDRALHIGIYLFRALHNDPGVKFPFFDCINVRKVVRN